MSNRFDYYIPPHRCGGSLRSGGSGEQQHWYCLRCGAFAYDSDPASVPAGTDPIANKAAWDEGSERSPEPVDSLAA